MAEPIIIPFVFEGEHAVRVLNREGKPWFVAADVCRAVGIVNHRDAVEKLAEDEKGVGKTDASGGGHETLIVSEGGLYTLVFRSHDAIKPDTVAYRFRRWVTDEVLPQIRRTGSYNLASSRHALAVDKAKAQQVMLARTLFGDAEARKLYVQLGLSATPTMQTAAQGDLFPGPV